MSGYGRPPGINSLPRRSGRGSFSKTTMQKQKQRRGPSSSIVQNYKPVETTPHYKVVAERVISVLKESNPKSGLSEAQLNICIQLLDSCDSSSPVAVHVEDTGYDIIQRVVAKGEVALLEYLLKRKFDLALNKRPCSSLLNIAVKYGHTAAIERLLDVGARLDHRSTVCYPAKHYVLNRGRSDLVCDYRCVGCCVQEKKDLKTALHVAVQQNNLTVLQVLLDHRRAQMDAVEPIMKRILEFACLKGALNCIPFLIQCCPREINQVDSKCRNLIELSFLTSEACGMRFLAEATNYDLEKNIVNSVPSGHYSGSLLHFIFSQENCIHFLDITKMMLKAGFERQNLRSVDTQKNTLLHLLMLQVGKRIANILIQHSLWQADTTSPDSYEEILKKLEQTKEEQLFACMKFLIENGVEIDALNTMGESIVHKLLHNCFYLNVSGFSTFCKILPQIIKILEYLLRSGFDASVSSDDVSSPLNYLVHTISSFSAEHLDSIWPNIWYLFTVLLKHGADPNVTDERGINNVSFLLTTLHRWLNYGLISDSSSEHNELPIRTINRIQDLLLLFFQYGLKPKQEVLELCCKQVAILCNIKCQDSEFIECVKGIFKPFFLNGVNPNSLRMITENDRSYGVPCQLHAQFYLARSFVIHRHTDAMVQFFSIFTNTLEREKLNCLLGGLCKILQENFDNTEVHQHSLCIEQVMNIRKSVRSLKVLSRICIANALSWKIEERKVLLPLPKYLTVYLSQL